MSFLALPQPDSDCEEEGKRGEREEDVGGWSSFYAITCVTQALES